MEKKTEWDRDRDEKKIEMDRDICIGKDWESDREREVERQR